MEYIKYKECITSLEENVLDNIILLKHASQLQDSAQYLHINSSLGIVFKPEQMQHDRVLYPDYDAIMILSDTNNIDCYLNALDSGKYIIKVNGYLNDSKYDLLQSFKSLTTNTKIEKKLNHSIVYEENIDTEQYQYLFGLVHYKIKDIENMIINNSASVFSIKINDNPVCTCINHQVYKNIWEIGALSTAEQHRRKYLAENLVSYVTDNMLSQKRTPRYHVNMKNIASYNLALKCGYKPFIYFNHYYYNKK
jgi:hypothetical protein